MSATTALCLPAARSVSPRTARSTTATSAGSGDDERPSTYVRYTGIEAMNWTIAAREIAGCHRVAARPRAARSNARQPVDVGAERALENLDLAGVREVGEAAVR